MSKIVLFEGPDKSGKTSIAKALSRQIKIPYFKNRMERNQKISGQTKIMTEFAVPYLLNYIEQTGTSCIMDRNYPSEWAYGQVEQRDIDLEMIRTLDNWFAAFETYIVICYKSYYEDFHDETTPREHLYALVQKYHEFVHWTNCPRILLLDTVNKDLEYQLEKITDFLNEKSIWVHLMNKKKLLHQLAYLDKRTNDLLEKEFMHSREE